MRTILVLTDFSIGADHAAHYAMKIARKLSADIMLCNIFPCIPETTDVPRSAIPNYDLLERDSLDDLAELAVRLNRENDAEQAPNNFRPIINVCARPGTVTGQVNEIAASCNALMIVISVHSGGSVSTFMLGDHTRDIIDHATYPVMVVPLLAREAQISKIAFATDLNIHSVDVLKCLSSLAKYYQAKILVTHVAPEPMAGDAEFSYIDQYRNLVSSLISYPAIDYRQFASENVADGLDWLSHHTNIDMIVLVHRKRGFFQKIFSPSITQKIVHKLTIPLLVFPQGHDRQSLPVF